MEKRSLHSLQELSAFATAFLSSISPRSERAVLVTLQGDLGAGKTAFTKEIAKLLGVEEIITSPTFVIEKKYKLKGQHFDTLIHIDAYRLESGTELSRLAWQDSMDDPKNLIFLEWPERVEEILPEEKIELKFTFIDDTTREIEYDAN